MNLCKPNTIELRGLQMEDFCNYKKPSMFLVSSYCDWKCCTERGYNISICQNSPLARSKIISYSIDEICKAYTNNILTSAIVIGGLEPMLQANEILGLIETLRDTYNDYSDIVIYTGYTEKEVDSNLVWSMLRQLNVIIKYGRFILDSNPRYDEILGVTLASENQYAVKY